MNRIREKLSLTLEDAIFYEGFDEALIGYAERCGLTVTLYDASKCICILEDNGLSYEEANDYFNYNMMGAYVGGSTPMFAFTDEHIL